MSQLLSRASCCQRILAGVAQLVLVLAVAVGAQHDIHDHSPNSGHRDVYERFQRPQVTYQLHATIDPANGLIKGWMDVSWENQSESKLQSICLDLGFSPYDEETRFDFYDPHYGDSVKNELTAGRATYCWFDSILCRASRLSSAPVMRNNLLLELEIPHGVNPGEKIPLIFFFETKFAEPVDDSVWLRIDEFFPQVAHYDPDYRRGQFLATRSVRATADHPFGQYMISLSVDSSYSIIAPGELLNEKEHFGTFSRAKPEDDTVFVDVTSSLYAFQPDRAYQPEFAGGVKTYHFRLLNGNNFPILLTGGFLLDRTFVDGLPIEIYYRPSEREQFAGRVARLARETLKEQTKDLGEFPYPKLVITSVANDSNSSAVREMISLPGSVSDELDIRRGLILSLSRVWFSDVLPAGYDLFAYARSPVVDEALAASYSELLLSKLPVTDPIGPAERATKWVAVIDESESYSMSMIAGQLALVDSVAAPGSFLRLLKDISTKFRFRIAGMDGINQLLEKQAGEAGLKLLQLQERRSESTRNRVRNRVRKKKKKQD